MIILTHSRLTKFAVQPNQPGNLKGLVSGNIFLPLIQLMVGGMAYVTPKATTLADTIALKALDEPKKMHPKIITQAVVQIKA